ncbi:MAG: hypothetical protein A2Y33_15420 [Spirochaetes bacterium GWF1_51_8]|nr:MAG: hypothetical protein A2Y33_15420 [Spirochaetes bacterium GWF1_51_8]
MKNMKKPLLFIGCMFLSILAFSQDSGDYNFNMAKGEVAYYNEEFDKALDYFSKAISIWDSVKDDPDGLVLAYNARANTYIDLGEYDSALLDLGKSIELNPDHYEAYYIRGFISLDLGKYEDALADYRKTVELKKDYTNAYINMSYILNLLNKYDESIEAVKYALELDDSSSRAYKNYANALIGKKAYDDAVKMLQQAVNLDEEYEEGFFLLGKLYLRKKEYYLAVENLDKAIELNDEREDAYYVRGIVYFQQENYKKAVEDFTKAIEFGPENAQAYYYRSQAYLALGKEAESNDDMEKAKALSEEMGGYTLDFHDPVLAEVTNANNVRTEKTNETDVTVDAGSDETNELIVDNVVVVNTNTTEPKNTFDENKIIEPVTIKPEPLMELDPALLYDSPETEAEKMYRLGIENLGKHLFLAAISNFSLSVVLDPASAKAYNGLGLSFCLTGSNYGDAFNNLNKAIKIDPQFPYSYCNIALTYYKTKDYKNAVYHIKKAIELKNEYSKAYFIYGMILDEMGKKEIALTKYTKALKINKNWGVLYTKPEVLIARANLFISQEKYDLALSDFKMAVKLKPNMLEGYTGKAFIYMKQKKYESALKEYDYIISKDPKNYLVYYHRGLAYSMLKKYKEGIKDFNKSISINKDFANAYIGKAFAYKNMGIVKFAIRDLMIASDKGSKEAKKYLKTIFDVDY